MIFTTSPAYVLRMVLATGLFVACLPGMILGWDSLSLMSAESCYDNRTGARFGSELTGNAGGECVSGAGAGSYAAYDDVRYEVRGDGVVEPVIYFEWRGADVVNGLVARLAQAGLVMGILLAAGSMAYLLLPMERLRW